MKQQIEFLGFKLISQCMCGGTLNQTFGRNHRFKGVKIKIMPTKHRFVISKDNYTIAKGKEDNFNEILIDNGFIKLTPEEAAIREAIRKIEAPETEKKKQTSKKPVSKRKTN